MLPQHEYFHQYFVTADAENELFREDSRGLPGGSFLLATILNRKDAKSKRGKDTIEAFKEFFLLKADATFCNYFLHKYNLDDTVDNTPPLLRKASPEQKVKYLHKLVSDALKDLLPYFTDAEVESSQLDDFPLAKGRRNEETSNNVQKPVNVVVLEAPSTIDSSLAEATATQVEQTVDKQEMIRNHLVQSSSSASSSRVKQQYSCSLCFYETKYEAIALSHIENCLKKLSLSSQHPSCVDPNPSLDIIMTDIEDRDSADGADDDDESKPDFYWNYKCSEFLVDSLFAISTVYEGYGDGLGTVQSLSLLHY